MNYNVSWNNLYKQIDIIKYLQVDTIDYKIRIV